MIYAVGRNEVSCLNNMYVSYEQFGDPKQVLQLRSKELSSPADHELVVEMLAAPINPSDLIPITGAYSHRISLPDIPGYEGVGIVREIGAAVDRSWLGQRVLPLRGEGTWQQFVKAPAELAIPVPAWIDNDTAAQLYINPVTAWIVLTETLSLKGCDILLMNAASSTLGLIVAQMCRKLGIQFIGITSSMQLKQKLLDYGASYILDADSDKAQLKATIMELTKGKGADGAIDCIGGLMGNQLAMCLRKEAVFVSLGLLSGQPVNWRDIHHRAEVRGKLFHLRHWNSASSAAQWHIAFQHIMSMIAEQQLVIPEPSARFSLSEVNAALAYYVAKQRTRGKVLLTRSEI